MFEFKRRSAGMFFKEVIEMGRLLKSQSITNLGNIPVRILQQVFRFFEHPFLNNLGSRKVSDRFYGRIQMVNVNVEVIGKI